MEGEIWESHETTLVGDAHRAHEHYDKALLALLSGAFAGSLTFVNVFVQREAGQGWGWLLVAWVLWLMSMAAILASYMTSATANWQEVTDCRRLRANQPPASSKPGGKWNTWTRVLNPIAGVLFFSGVVFAGVFANQNMRGKSMNDIQRRPFQTDGTNHIEKGAPVRPRPIVIQQPAPTPAPAPPPAPKGTK